jgi:L-glutamine-phosphate cytidylyltransferase
VTPITEGKAFEGRTKAIVLAAGRGGRLSGVTGDHPKCLARVGSCTLVERQLATLRSCGLDDITVVVGYHAADVLRVCGPGVGFVHNARFASTNSLYSLWLARDLLADGCVVLNCDVLFHPQLLVDLLTARYEDALLVAGRGDEVYHDEEMKVRIRGGRVVDIAKTIDPAGADGENIGVAKFGRSGAATLVEELSRLVDAAAVHEWLPAAFNAFCRRRPLWAVDSRGFPWIEIDFPEDYWRACSEVLPAIEALDNSRSHPPAAGREATNAVSGRTAHHV